MEMRKVWEKNLKKRSAKRGNKTEHRILGNILIDQGEVRGVRMSQWIQKWSDQTNRRKIKAVYITSAKEGKGFREGMRKGCSTNDRHWRGQENGNKTIKYFFLICLASAAAAKSLQLCLTLCDPIDGSPPGSPIPGILQARTLEWVPISFSNAWKWKVKVKSLSRVRPFATPWTAAYQAPPSMGFSRQEYWSGLPLPSPWLASKGYHIKIFV